MIIIILPTAYANPYAPQSANFVQSQAISLAKHPDLEIHVIGAIPISLKDVWKRKNFSFGFYHDQKNGVQSTLFLFPAIPKLRWFNNCLRFFINKILLKKFTKNHAQADVVHVHNVVAAKAALWYKNHFCVPYCVTEHSSAFGRNLLSRQELSLYKNLYRHANYTIAVSEDLCQLLYKMTSIKFEYIPNVIHTDFFRPSSKQEKSKQFRFVNIAYLNKNKNHKRLIEAFALAFKTDKNVNLVIIGSGSECDNLKNEIEKYAMQDQIALHGFASRDEVLKQLQHSDAFVLSSNYETFGVVIVEAMSCGLPVVSTKCGGPESIIVNENLGLLVEPTAKALAEGMQKMVQTHYDKTVIRNFAIENFSEKVISEKLINIYKKIQ